MQYGYRSQLLCQKWQGALVFLLLGVSCALLAGCGQQENILHLLRECNAKAKSQCVTQPSDEIQPLQAGNDTLEWGFTADTQLTRLPMVCSGETPFVGLPDQIEGTTAIPQMLGTLLAPVALPEETDSEIPPLVETEVAQAPIENLTVERPLLAVESDMGKSAHATFGTLSSAVLPNAQIESAFCHDQVIVAPTKDELSSEERRLLEVIARDTLAVSTGVQTDVRLDQQSRHKIGSAYALAQRGASYAARQELIEVLRMVSQAKDNREGTRTRSESLASGLRALEEAEDFVPRGTQLEAEMALEVICASHRTPLAQEADFSAVLPSQMMDRYNRYAQIKLALAVAGEPAGSMALYTLGKLNSQLGDVEPEQHRMAKRRAVAFQQAALLAHNQNYLAAHELGVLLAETGHLPEARQLLQQVARREPNAVVYRNLAKVHDELGQASLAIDCRNLAEMLVEQGRGPAAQVAWVSPQQFAQSAPLNETPQIAAQPSAPLNRY